MPNVKLSQSGKTARLDFTKSQPVISIPNLLTIQKESFQDFIENRLKQSIADYFPVYNDSKDLVFKIKDFKVCYDEIKYSIDECKRRGVNYEAPVKANVYLEDKISGEIIEDMITIGNLPIMTPNATFIINGTEKVVLSQIVRSPGCYYSKERSATGEMMYSGVIIPSDGAWLTMEAKGTGLFVKIDKNTKAIPITTLLRILGVEKTFQFKEYFGDSELIEKALEKDESKDKKSAYTVIYKILMPKSLSTLNNAISYIDSLIFNVGRHISSNADCGRYKFDKKLSLSKRIIGTKLVKDVRSQLTGEIVSYAGETITEKMAEKIQNSGESVITVEKKGKLFKVISNRMVDSSIFGEEYKEVGTEGKVYFPEMMKCISLQSPAKEEYLEKNIQKIKADSITKDDILAAISYIVNLDDGLGNIDDIDHLSNRRVRRVGELMNNAYRRGLAELSTYIATTYDRFDRKELTPRKLFNSKIMNRVIMKDFFNQRDASMADPLEQDNPLTETAQKRRITATGKGGLNKDRAGFEVRDINGTQYGRLCPVETPEGTNIGLNLNLALYATINKYGFIEVPYRVVKKDKKGIPYVSDEIVYLEADEEEKMIIAQASEELDDKCRFTNETILCRKGETTAVFNNKDVDLMDISTGMMFSVTANMIPFVQNDDANRALMGANMMKQAVPLIFCDSAVVATGVDDQIARESGGSILAEESGTVVEVDSERILVKGESGSEKEYTLEKYKKSNNKEAMNQTPNVFVGDKVKAGEIIADGAATKNGEIALGQNPLIGFMEWEGYNYEDAVLISERLVRDDVYTSIHIQSYDIETKETIKEKNGIEQITANMPGYSSFETRNLDETGVVRIGAEVKEGDVLVGKITPISGDEIEVSEKIMNDAMGIKTRKVKNTPLKMPHGSEGIVIAVDRYSQENGDELPYGVQEKVIVYIAQKRKLSVGDKMAGRHGNKGIVSRVLPVEDMPYLENGRPLDIVLNPLGVPSRMNIGQILELHLGLLSKVLGIKVTTPIFNGANEKTIAELQEVANDYLSKTTKQFEKKYKGKYAEDIIRAIVDDDSSKKEWEGIKIHPGCKLDVYDGRTGEKIPCPIAVGYMHYMKLHHLADDKIHSRATGHYQIITQQPLAGKAQEGGQRFGEMEVWALEAYGASNTLQEILTIKSDDVNGRTRAYNAILDGEPIPTPNVPESFRVLIKTFQGLGIDVTAYDQNMEPINPEAEIINLHNNKFLEDKYGFNFDTGAEFENATSSGYHVGFGDMGSNEEIDSLFDGEEEE